MKQFIFLMIFSFVSLHGYIFSSQRCYKSKYEKALKRNQTKKSTKEELSLMLRDPKTGEYPCPENKITNVLVNQARDEAKIYLNTLKREREQIERSNKMDKSRVLINLSEHRREVFEDLAKMRLWLGF